MGHRELRRVPLDFDAPLNEVWEGYRTPSEFEFPACPDCVDAPGYGPEAAAISNTFYPTQIAADWSEAELARAGKLAWADKIGQAEVDNLVAEGRLPVWDPELEVEGRIEHGYRGGWRWHEPRTAAEVNALNQPGHRGLDGHDAINHGILVRFRCQVLGIPLLCPTCGGDAIIATDEQKAAADAWQWTEPPTGESFQLWETTSEGSPVSPVFASAEELADWCVMGATAFGGIRWNRQQWLGSFQAGTTDVDSMFVAANGKLGTAKEVFSDG